MARGRPRGSKNKVSSPPIESAPFRVTLKSLGRTFSATGDSFEDAVKNIKVSGGVKVSSVLTVTQGDRVKEKIINGRIARALFGEVSPTSREIHLKSVRAMFDL